MDSEEEKFPEVEGVTEGEGRLVVECEGVKDAEEEGETGCERGEARVVTCVVGSGKVAEDEGDTGCERGGVRVITCSTGAMFEEEGVGDNDFGRGSAVSSTISRLEVNITGFG